MIDTVLYCFVLLLWSVSSFRLTLPAPVLSNFGVGRIPLFPLLAVWGSKNWLPSMNMKKMENFQNKMGLIGCIWPSLNAPGITIHVCHPILELGEFPFSIISPLG